MEKQNKIIELTNVSKVYDGTTVVDDFNLYVKKGEFITLLGPSGCGKTTTLRMIAGFEMPDAGKIELNGVDITNLPPYKRPINTVFQRYALFPHLDVYDNIAFGLKLKKLPKQLPNSKIKMIKYSEEEIDEKVTRVLKLVDLEEFEDRDVTTLSGGQQQRVAIARAIVNEPEILLLDEPLGALDLKMRKDMQLELKAMHEKLGITFIYVTHDQEEALTMSDTIVVMKDGKIQQVGTPTDIYNEPKNAYVADFIGESNILNGTMMGPCLVRFIGATLPCVDDFPKNEKVDVVVRPEDIKLSLELGDVNGKIITKVFKGIHYEYTVRIGKNELTVQSTIEYPLNDMVSVNIEPDAIHIMHKEFVTNIYSDAWLDDKNRLVIDDVHLEDVDVTGLVPNGTLDEEGYLYNGKGTKYDLKDADVIAEIPFNAIEVSDDEVEGQFVGHIVEIIYKGDHSRLTIRTENDEDFVMNTPYSWNLDDKVSIAVDPSKIKIRIKGDIANYEA